jgi:arylsulfatase A-like enzyme
MSRHFVWLTPLANLFLFLALGILLALFTRLRRRSTGWLGFRVLLAAALLPAFLVAGPRVYAAAWIVLSLGIAWRVVPLIEHALARGPRWPLFIFPALLALVPLAAVCTLGESWLKEWREARRPRPERASPNVLLVVLDTVRADHMSLHGYYRPTTPELERLAKQGIRFDEARATAPWTLPSHASIFTGRWPYELDVKWMSPLHTNFPSLAGYLGRHGYATAGFVGNTLYCSYETGLDRGFTHYEDYVVDLSRLRFIRMALLADRLWSGVSSFGLTVYRNLGSGPLRTWLESALRPLLATDRKDARSINRDFLDWLSHRREPERPFFAFLNYFDAHAPYLPPEGTVPKFGLTPQTDADFFLLKEFWLTVDKLRLSSHYQTLIRDSYDNCIAYLDEQLGELFDALKKAHILDETLLIVTADHGEELGDHSLFDHGESLYRPEIRVPLLVVLPAREQSASVVRETVSLRNLPATVVDLVGLAGESPFPGRSLAPLWRQQEGGGNLIFGNVDGALSELSSPNPSIQSQGHSPADHGPLVSLASGDFVYIRNELSGSEELFNEHEDPQELLNRARVPSQSQVLKRMRQCLDQIKSRPHMYLSH